MKRFLLFSGYNYYPNGGWLDLKGSYDTIEEVNDAIVTNPSDDWYQIVDTTTGVIVNKINRY